MEPVPAEHEEHTNNSEEVENEYEEIEK